jgi:hypothetical protein
MKTTIDNVWPNDIIKTDHGIGRVKTVWNEKEYRHPAVVEYSWHEKGYQWAYFDWDEKVQVK